MRTLQTPSFVQVIMLNVMITTSVNKHHAPPCGCEQVYSDVCFNSGVYTVDCGCGPFTAHCNMEGNWTIFQRRFNGAVGIY